MRWGRTRTSRSCFSAPSRDVGGIEDPVDAARVEVVDAVHVDGHLACRDADRVEQQRRVAPAPSSGRLHPQPLRQLRRPRHAPAPRTSTRGPYSNVDFPCKRQVGASYDRTSADTRAGPRDIFRAVRTNPSCSSTASGLRSSTGGGSRAGSTSWATRAARDPRRSARTRRRARAHDPAAYADLEQSIVEQLPDEPVDAIGFSLGAQLLLRRRGCGFGPVRAARRHRCRRELLPFRRHRTPGGRVRGGVEPDDVALRVFVNVAASAGNDPLALAACLRRPSRPYTADEIAARDVSHARDPRRQGLRGPGRSARRCAP